MFKKKVPKTDLVSLLLNN